MQFRFMNVILLHSDHQHVSTTRVAIFRVVSARIQIYLKCFGISPQLQSYSFGCSSAKWQNNDEYNI
jgi:hypothetical protein